MNITDVKAILGRKLAGANIDDIQGISDYTLFKEAAVNLISQVRPAETTRRTTLSVFTDVYDYAPPTDLVDVKDIRPQTATRDERENPTRRFTEDFDQEKGQEDFSLEWEDANRKLRYVKSVGGNIGIHTMDGLATNGTWDGTAANIALDTENPYKGSGSIIADYDTGEYIENDDFTAVDLSDHKNKSTLFLAAYFPDASLVTDVALRWGSSSSAYFSRTVTAPQFGSFRNGWNLIPFVWNGATETGTVDATGIDYLRVTLTLSTSDTDIKIDNIFSALGEIQDLVYYSKYLFRSSAGTWLEAPTADSDLVNLDDDAENLFVYECIRLAARGLQGRSETYLDYTKTLYGDGKDVGDYARYKERNPEERIRPQSQYRNLGYNKK